MSREINVMNERIEKIVENCEPSQLESWAERDNLLWHRSNSANSIEPFNSEPMFVRRSYKPEFVTISNDSDLENDVEILLDKNDDGTHN